MCGSPGPGFGTPDGPFGTTIGLPPLGTPGPGATGPTTGRFGNGCRAIDSGPAWKKAGCDSVLPLTSVIVGKKLKKMISCATRFVAVSDISVSGFHPAPMIAVNCVVQLQDCANVCGG